MSLTTSYSEHDKSVTIRISERFDFSVHREFRQAYRDRVPGAVRYVVDLNGTEYMDSSALGMLLLLREHAAGSDSSIRIINCSPEIRQILAISNFSKLFEIT
jgi:anti-anti-sigma factor